MPRERAPPAAVTQPLPLRLYVIRPRALAAELLLLEFSELSPYAVPGSQASLFDLLPRAAVIYDEEELVRAEVDRWWEQVQSVHERSGVGNLVRPTNLYLEPEALTEKIGSLPGGSFEHLGLSSSA